ncbi:BT4734/BF3469 family protein [Flavobacterium artemisiae]|uniref:BT4734/BF3469 family protein n=1 Tax=Flavobacterium artemisiae TaxID=2126556 RepID=A0ABW4HDL8_9FLAO
MKKLSEITVTKFNTIKSKECSTILMFEELRNIKSGKYKDLVLKCREAYDLGDKDIYTFLKSQLPAVTFCGEFKNGHKASDLVIYNNLIVIDIDGLLPEDILNIKSTLILDKYILALWDSPSGRGLKGLIKTESTPENHKDFFNSLRVYFLDNYQIELDKSGSDVSRLCFSSWDENIFYNSNSEIYKDFLEIDITTKMREESRPIKEKNLSLSKSAYATEGLNKSEDRILIKKIIKYLTKKNLSITENYDSWVKVALGISYTFSYDVGEKYFTQLCSLDNDKYDAVKSTNLLKYCYNRRQVNLKKTISLATIAYFAKEKGFKL